jgi:hypothetical protein
LKTGLGATTAAALAGGVAGRRQAAATARLGGETYREPEREIPIVEQADVVVCGGGPAGVAAALAAARQGAKTRLIEVNGCLGGVWTAGLLTNIIDYRNKPGIMQEILARLDERDARIFDSKYDVEKMKLLLEEMAAEAGVRVRLHTRVAAAVRDEDERLRMAVTESKSGREGFAGKVFIDATGDGDLAALAGCGFDYGRPEREEGQPMSYLVLLVGLDFDRVKPYVSGLPGETWAEPKAKLAAEIRRGSGHDPSYAHPTLFYLGHGIFSLMANHEYRVRGYDAGQLTEATQRARGEVHRMIDGLRGLGGIWSDMVICATPEHIGVREGRRIHGLYQLTADDLIAGARFEDAVCRSTFCVDVHSTNPDESKGLGSEGVRAKPYDIPFRALIARDVQGLMMAGRCISGDFFAHASYRVTGNAVAMGQAAGTAAALAAARGQLPHELAWQEVRERL